METRRSAQQLLSKCDSDPRIGKYSTINVPRVVRRLHSAVLAYADQIRPKSERLREGLWKVDLMQEDGRQRVEVPKSGTYDMGSTDMYGDIDFGDVLQEADTEYVEVNPNTLNRHWREGNQITLTAVAHAGSREISEDRTYTYHLPPAACSALINHLDECVEDMDWLPGGRKEIIAEMDPEGNIIQVG